jgi:hypothetical protein
MALRPYLSIVHHVPGRIRLRFDLAAVSALGGARLSAFAEEAQVSGAIRSFRVNSVARSLTIEYEPASLAPTLWTRFLTGDEEEAAGIAARLAPHLAGGSQATGAHSR